MAPPRIAMPIRGVASQLSRARLAADATPTAMAMPCLQRSIATSASAQASVSALTTSARAPFAASTVVPFEKQAVNATIHQFPSLEPLRFEAFPASHLYLPTRRDILHRAVIYEGDNTRSGTANTKWRDEVHGSARKMRPQKGTGRARLGDKKSPMLRGGGVAFGPKPRDFGTHLPRKVYDLAWRTALSYRFRKGELVIVEDAMELEIPSSRLLNSILGRWPDPTQQSLMVTLHERPFLSAALDRSERPAGRTLTWEEVDVKDLLGQGRLLIERRALKNILQTHQADITERNPKPKYTDDSSVRQPHWSGSEEYQNLIFAPRAERQDMKPELFTALGLKRVEFGREQEKKADYNLKLAAKLNVQVLEKLKLAATTESEAEKKALEKESALLQSKWQTLSKRGREQLFPAIQLVHDGLEMQRDAQLQLVARTEEFEHMISGFDQAEQVEFQAKAKELEAELHEFLAKWEEDQEEVERLTASAHELRKEADELKNDAANIRADAEETSSELEE